MFTPHHLADAGVAGEHVGVLHDGELRWGVVCDLQHAAPLGKVSAVLLILGTSLVQPVQTWHATTTTTTTTTTMTSIYNTIIYPKKI